MRPLWSLKRIIRRYGWHPAKAIYREQLRRRYMRLGRWLERRQAPKPPIAMITPPTTPPVAPYVPLPQTLQWPNVEWSRYYYETHPDLYTSRTPLRSRKTVRLEPLPGEIWLNSLPTTDPITMSGVPTQPGIVEATAKYESLPKFLRGG